MGSNCSLILPEPNLFLGGVSCFPFLDAYGVQASLSLGAERPKETSGIHVLQFKIEDDANQRIDHLFAEAIDFIFENRLNGKVVLVHCRAGVSRSVSFLIAYLMTVFQWTRDEALAYIVQYRSVAGPNSGFLRVLNDFAYGEDSDRDILRSKLRAKYGEKFDSLVEKDLELVRRMNHGQKYQCQVQFKDKIITLEVHSVQRVDFLLRLSKGRFFDDPSLDSTGLEKCSIWHGEHLDKDMRFEDLTIIKNAPFVLIEPWKSPYDDSDWEKLHGGRFPEEFRHVHKKGADPLICESVEEEIEGK